MLSTTTSQPGRRRTSHNGHANSREDHHRRVVPEPEAVEAVYGVDTQRSIQNRAEGVQGYNIPRPSSNLGPAEPGDDEPRLAILTGVGEPAGPVSADADAPPATARQ